MTAVPERDRPGPLVSLSDLQRVELPALSREELAALGPAASSPLVDEVEQAWTDGLPDVEQVRARGLASLRARGLVDDEGRMAPELVAVLAARSNPSVLVTEHQPGREGRRAPRCYGTQDGAGELAWLLVERVADGTHDFTAVTPQRAAADVAAWLTDDSDLRDGGRLRGVDVLHPGSGDRPTMRAHALVVTGVDGSLACMALPSGELSGAAPTDAPEVRRWLSAALRGEGLVS